MKKSKNIISIDIAGKSTAGISCFNSSSGKLLECISIKFEKGSTPRLHRQKINCTIENMIDTHGSLKAIIFERINLFRNSKIAFQSILSLARAQTSIIDKFGSEDCKIFDVNVQSWKSTILGNRSATKQDAVDFVLSSYPQIRSQLELKVNKKGEQVYDHDLADAICIGRFLVKEGMLSTKLKDLTNE